MIIPRNEGILFSRTSHKKDNGKKNKKKICFVDFQLESIYNFNFYSADLVYRKVKLRFFLKYGNLNRKKDLELLKRFVWCYNVFDHFAFV